MVVGRSPLYKQALLPLLVVYLPGNREVSIHRQRLKLVIWCACFHVNRKRHAHCQLCVVQVLGRERKTRLLYLPYTRVELYLL